MPPQVLFYPKLRISPESLTNKCFPKNTADISKIDLIYS